MKYQLILFLSSIGMYAFAQEYILIDTVKLNCIYWYEFQQDSTSRYSLKGQEMILQIGEHHSKFAAVHTLFNDSVLMAYANEPNSQAVFDKIWALTGRNITHSYCKHYIYKNYPGKDTITFTSYLNHKYPKIVEHNSLNWRLINNSDTTILDYRCKKATTRYAGRNYVAWFTMDIPVSDGPHKFSGLPGLIVKINDTQNQHCFQLTSVEKPKWIQPIFFIKDNFVEITAKEYTDALNVRMSQLFNKIQHEDGITIDDDEQKSRALHNVKSRNNFIELY